MNLVYDWNLFVFCLFLGNFLFAFFVWIFCLFRVSSFLLRFLMSWYKTSCIIPSFVYNFLLKTLMLIVTKPWSRTEPWRSGYIFSIWRNSNLGAVDWNLVSAYITPRNHVVSRVSKVFLIFKFQYARDFGGPLSLVEQFFNKTINIFAKWRIQNSNFTSEASRFREAKYMSQNCGFR